MADLLGARLTVEGKLDPTFGTDGIAVVDPTASDDMALGVAIDSLDRVFVTGISRTGLDSATTFATLVGYTGEVVDEFGDNGIKAGGFGETATESSQPSAVAITGRNAAYVGIVRIEQGSVGGSVIAYDLPEPDKQFRCSIVPGPRPTLAG